MPVCVPFVWFGEMCVNMLDENGFMGGTCLCR